MNLEEEQNKTSVVPTLNSVRDFLMRYWREIVLGVLLLATGAFIFYTTALSERLLSEEKRSAEVQQELRELKIGVETLIALSAENTKAEIEKRLAEEREKIANLESSLSSETQKRVALEGRIASESGLSSQRLNELEKSFSNNYDLASIISTWRKRTANISCQFSFGVSRGSGVLTYLSNGNGARYGVLTNQHVVMYNGRAADRCTVTLPDNGLTFTATRSAGQIETSTTGHDFARLLISDVNSFTTANAATEKNLCVENSAVVGDELVILGYPTIGSGSDITATEGIVSGSENDYFITSAKVEQGNSGGSAVLLKNNCLLGIPTFVQLGSVESLARILNIQAVLK